MADETTVDSTTETAGSAPAKKATARKAATKRTTATKTATKAAAKTTTKKTTARKTAARRPAERSDAELPLDVPGGDEAPAPAKKTAAKRTTRKRAASAGEATPTEAASAEATSAEAASEPSASSEEPSGAPAEKTAARKTTAKKTTAKKTATRRAPAVDEAQAAEAAPEAAAADAAEESTAPVTASRKRATRRRTPAAAEAATTGEQPAEGGEAGQASAATAEAAEAADARAVLFQAPAKKTTSRRRKRAADEATEAAEATEATEAADATDAAEEPSDEVDESAEVEVDEAAETDADEATETDADEGADAEADEAETPARRRRRRGGRRRRRSGGGEDAETDESAESADETDEAEQTDEAGETAQESGSSRRRRRRRRSGDSGDDEGDNPPNTVTKVRESRPLEQQITAVSGSTRLEAKKQRRREGREAGRRRAPIVSEAEFLARRESVERVMVIRQRGDLTQIGVVEDKVLVEHYVARESQTSLIGNIYLGRVQNVLPSMEAAFIDIGKGRNAVLYAGEVNWSALGWKEGQPRKIESVLNSGQSVLVQVTKDPIGHKGARLTSQISLAGRFLVYVPDGTTSGISRKLPDTERNRLKTLLKEIVPDTAGVIVRTAAEGASEDELTRDVERLKARWDDIEAKAKGSAPQLLYGEPDLTLKVVRDLFTEDFSKLVIQGEEAWETVQSYVSFVAPDLESRLERFIPGEDGSGADAFAAYRIDEQIAKGLDRKVWLPSGGSLIIDRTEAMTVIDVNTGKFTGSGGNLEETVTKNNLEAAEEIVRQLRLRDIGGIIVVDFIDMVLESNRDLVLRRLVECLGRDRTRHQVAEVTSLGLVQMTRKRIGTGLLEAFSETCTHCQGRGIVVHDHPVEEGKSSGVLPDEPRRSRRSRGGRGRGSSGDEQRQDDSPRHDEAPKPPSPAVVAAMARHHDDSEPPVDGTGHAEVAVDEVATEHEAPVEVVTDQPDQPDQPEPESVTPAEPEQPARPKVVTRTRRGASRSVVTTGAAAVVDAPAPATDAAAASDTTEEPVAVPEVVAPPAPPKVVTRRRRGASRDVTTAVSASTDGSGERVAGPGGASGEPVPTAPEGAADGPVVEHVPVKKRGARKR